MKPIRLLFMLTSLMVFSTSIGATIPDWRKSSKNVVDELRQPTLAAPFQTAKKVVLIIGSPIGHAQTVATVEEVMRLKTEQLTLSVLRLEDYAYDFKAPVSVIPKQYNKPVISTAKERKYVNHRLPRDGIRYGSFAYMV